MRISDWSSYVCSSDLSWSCAPCQSELETTTSPGGTRPTCSATAVRRSDNDRAWERSIPGPPPYLCKWDSVRPGETKPPLKSMTCVLAPICGLTASSDPTARKGLHETAHHVTPHDTDDPRCR